MTPSITPQSLGPDSRAQPETRPDSPAQTYLPDSYVEPGLPPGVVWVDDDDRIVNLSTTACTLIGPIIDDYVGQQLSSLIALPGQLPRTDRTAPRRVSGYSIAGRPLVLTALGKSHASGRGRWCGSGAEGDVRAIIILDGSPLQQMAEQLVAAERLAALGRLTEEHAHAIANPLSAVLAVGAVLEHAGLSDLERSRLVRQLIAEAQRASSRVAQLLSAAHAAHGPATRVDIADLVRSTSELKRPAMQAAGIRLVVECPEEPLWVSIQAGALEQALLLVLDAIGDGRARSGSIKQQAISRHVELCLTVSHEMVPGVNGAPGAAIDVALPPHWRRASDRLALSRALSLVRSQGAVIRRGRFDGYWRRVTCLVPLVGALGDTVRGQIGDGAGAERRADAAWPPALTSLGTRPATTVAQLRPAAETKRIASSGSAGRTSKDVPEVLGLRALVVDDEAVYRSATARLLRIHGASLVIESATGQEALAVVDEDPNICDVILLDMRMPGLTGAQVYQALKQRAPSLARRTLFMVGERVEGQLAQFFADHDLPFVAKPYEPHALLKLLKELRARQEDSPGELVLDPAQ